MSRVQIPLEEYKQRVKNAAAKAAEWGLDVLIVNGSESATSAISGPYLKDVALPFPQQVMLHLW